MHGVLRSVHAGESRPKGASLRLLFRGLASTKPDI